MYSFVYQFIYSDESLAYQIHCAGLGNVYNYFPPQIIEADRLFFDPKDILHLILIPEASWFQKCNFQNPRDISLRFNS